MAVPAVAFLVLLTTAPETPRWLLSVGRARKYMSRPRHFVDFGD
jgi:hypothetical protein